MVGIQRFQGWLLNAVESVKLPWPIVDASAANDPVAAASGENDAPMNNQHLSELHLP